MIPLWYCASVAGPGNVSSMWNAASSVATQMAVVSMVDVHPLDAWVDRGGHRPSIVILVGLLGLFGRCVQCVFSHA